jgi:hypothetical protein
MYPHGEYDIEENHDHCSVEVDDRLKFDVENLHDEAD